MLDGTGLDVVSASGTSFAAPMVAGVAGLIVSDNLGTFAIPDGAALKKTLLSKHTIVDSVGLKAIPGSRLLTMSNLP
jgi:subtilisin family serine protease